MIKKNKEIVQFIKLADKEFGLNTLLIMDHWEEDISAIGLQRDGKLIYIANYGVNSYFYELELLVDDPGQSH